MKLILGALMALFPIVAAAQCVAPPDGVAMARGIYAGVNAERQALGLRPLAVDVDLVQAAQVHACDIARTGKLDHVGSDGSSSHRRVVRAGFRSCLTAENIALGFREPERIMAGWMASPGHRANIVLDQATAMGLGVAQGPAGPMWVLGLARRC